MTARSDVTRGLWKTRMHAARPACERVLRIVTSPSVPAFGRIVRRVTQGRNQTLGRHFLNTGMIRWSIEQMHPSAKFSGDPFLTLGNQH